MSELLAARGALEKISVQVTGDWNENEQMLHSFFDWQTERSINNLLEETMNFIPVYVPLRTEQEIDKNFENFVDWIQHA